MKDAAIAFLKELHDQFSNPKPSPRWLSFTGSSGSGKTFLCQLIRQHAPKYFFTHPSFARAGAFIDWPETIHDLRNESTRASAYAAIDNAIRDNLVFIDDIGASKDSEFAAAELHRLLNRRLNHWTLITSNRSLEAIADSIDTRISSRLIRGRNVCIEINTVDFALRKNRRRPDTKDSLP